MRRRCWIGWLGPLILAASLPAPGTNGGRHADHIAVADSSSPGYLEIPILPEVRVRPDADERLLVFRDGEVLLDLGLRDENEITQPMGSDGTPWIQERGVKDIAHIAHDARSAVVVSTSFLLRSVPDGYRGMGASAERVAQARSSLNWIDADHPGGRWTLELEQNRLFGIVHVFAGARGVLVTTGGGDGGSTDLRVLGPDREPIVHLEDLASGVPAIDPTPTDLFLAVDLSFLPAEGRADRGILVVDMLRESHWVYAWTYGSDEEPISWELEDTGVLVVQKPGETVRYDRLGLPLRR